MNFPIGKKNSLNFSISNKPVFKKVLEPHKIYLTTTLAVLETALYDLSPANFTVNL